MSNYNTGNPVPSVDPRDLDDNATVFDLLLQSTDASVPDRLGQLRKTWYQMEQDAAALVSPNVSSLAGLTLSANKGLYATGAGELALYDLSSLGRTLGGIANAAAGRTALGAAASGDNTDITSITGSAASLTTARSISATGDATWTVNFNGTANATAAITLSNTGVGAGTYGSVTVSAKGLVTAASTITPVANGGTGQSTTANYLADLQTAGAYGRTNILGVVGLAGAVPTGAIIENGTNANGEFVKFASGDMICRIVRTLTVTISSASGSVFEVAAGTWTFPAAFASGTKPSISHSASSTSNIVWDTLVGGSLSNTSVNLYLLSTLATGSITVEQTLIATGKWV